MQEAYSTLTSYYNVLPAQFHLQRIPDGIQISNALIIKMAKAHVLDNILVDWLVSISYISVKVAIRIPPGSGGGTKRKGDLQDLQIRLQERA